MTRALILYRLFPRATFKTWSPINPPRYVQLPEPCFRLCYKRIKKQTFLEKPKEINAIFVELYK